LRSDYITTDTVGVLLWALQPANRLVCEVALQTGWRVDDVLSLRVEELKMAKKNARHWLTITEQKTGKRSRKTLPVKLIDELPQQSGIVYIFEGRDDYRKHRSRQAVFYDLKKAAKRFNLRINLSPHSLRKNYAVYLREQGKTLEQIQEALNHADMVTTMLYAFSDELQAKYAKKKGRS
jgi:integrase